MIAFLIAHREHPARLGRLARLVLALRAQGGAGLEIIVSDQSPLPHFPVRDLLSAYYYEPREIFSKARALNHAARLARAPWLCQIDSDVIPPDDFLELLTYWIRPRWRLPFYGVFRVLEGERLHYDPPTPWGSDLQIFPRALWEEIGGYCEDFEGYGYEDVDFYDRALAAGAVRLETGITVQHNPHPQVATIHQDLDRNRQIYERRSK